MDKNLKKIQSPEEIKEMVDAFYDKVNNDELLSPVFNEFVGVDWENHLPIMYSFWGSILLGEFSYKGNPFLKHIPLPIEKIHFDRWLQLFIETIEDHFTGETAEEAIQRAKSIAGVFQYKLASMKK